MLQRKTETQTRMKKAVLVNVGEAALIYSLALKLRVEHPAKCEIMK